MAYKKISELSGVTNPNLTGITVVVDNGTTYKSTLRDLRNVLVDSGSHYFTGSQIINGDLIISGSLTAQQYILSSSISNILIESISGSTSFGNSLDDNHIFTGSIKVFGPVSSSFFVGDGSQLTNLPIQEIETGSFAITGSNIFVGNQTISGSINFGDGGVIQSISSSSGDGGGYSTLTLTPDLSLGSDQYIILDPTGPNHIHIRPGGTIDSSNTDLYLGGEKNYVRVNNSTPSVRMQTESTTTINSYYFSPGFGVASIEWYTQSGNHYVRFNDPTMDVYNAIWAFNDPSTFTATYNSGNDYISFTVNGSSTPGFPQAPSFYVLESPPSSPTYLDYADIQILQNRQSYVDVQNRDISINADDDLRLYSRDIFRLANYSENEPIEIVANYDNNDKTFTFNPNGSLGFPDGTYQNTAFVTSSIAGSATTGSNTFVGNQIISGSKYLAVETIQNLSGSLSLITAGGNVEILASNLNVPNGGIITNYNVSASSLTGSLDWSHIINEPSLISGSSQISNLGYAITGSNTFIGNQTITGSLRIEDDNNFSKINGFKFSLANSTPNLIGNLDSVGIYAGYDIENDITTSLASNRIFYITVGESSNYWTFGRDGALTVPGLLKIKGVSEDLILDSGFSGNRDFDYSSGSIFYLTGITGNGTWNVNNVPTDNNKAITLTFIISQGVTPYSGSQYQINSSNVTVKWADNEIPTGSANNVDVIGLTAFRVGSSWNVLGSLSTFGS